MTLAEACCREYEAEVNMRWRDLERSSNVEDRRGGGGRRGVPVKGAAGAVVLLVVMVAGYYGIDLTPMLSGTGLMESPAPTSEQYRPSAQEQELAEFVFRMLATTEKVWGSMVQGYKPPRLVLYTGTTHTACGAGQAETGPFYCPADNNVYIDLSFYNEMKSRMGGGGDFALGYVLAHEIGHHVQNQIGTAQKVREMQARVGKADANRLSVMMELQADCYAGVWGHAVDQAGILEAGDLAEALNTAAAIGDDRLQRQSTGRVMPDSFTHGTSQQRYAWFKRGFDSGDPRVCNTFENVR